MSDMYKDNGNLYRKCQAKQNNMSGYNNMSDRANAPMGETKVHAAKSRGEVGVSKLPQPK